MNPPITQHTKQRVNGIDDMRGGVPSRQSVYKMWLVNDICSCSVLSDVLKVSLVSKRAYAGRAHDCSALLY